MRQFKFASVLLMALVVVGCGGGGAGSQAPKVAFTSQVSFGDSLSDVGTYKVGVIPLMTGGGGQFTINGAGKNWTELMAAQFGLPAPCAAETGIYGVPGIPAVPASSVPGCTGYAQGGAQVTAASGIGNPGSLVQPGFFLTVPVVQQITNHLSSHGGKFSGSEIVFVLAGANDVLTQFGLVGGGAISPTSGVIAVSQAATDLVTDINTQILANGAKYVTVVNIPDISTTPFGVGTGPSGQGLLTTMVTAFNSVLQGGLAGNPNVLLVDANTVSHDQIINPAPYGLTNVTTTACNLTKPSPNPLGSSLVCNTTNLNPGVVDHYQFADTVHPTPYGYWLLARLVSKDMITKGWL